ncbi:hypothetical protein CVT24_007733 [Panaeolus cyanescens]|uniref:Replication protein A C-terminal domain-containing protein n=1 Tax=Panaeolus cyanescens TaxID=181874 RepID=A0A409YKN5_9AGAR|nr:hypothetical protein CVT24_007733 [Panaeolus cyanescens]
MSQFDTGYYGGNGGAGGGGYLQSPFSASGSPSGGRQRTEIQESLRSLTIAQLNKASQLHSEADWKVDDMEIGQVTVVAHVVSMQTQTTNTVYVLEDGTGQIEARHWIDEGTGSRLGDIKENRYIRVVGLLKVFGKKRYINVSLVRGVEDPHEIYFHMLDAISTTLTVERGQTSMTSPSKAALASPGMSAYSATNSVHQDQLAHFQGLNRMIMQFILEQPPTDEGIHVAAIAKAIGPSGYDPKKISDALDELMDQGHVFTTIDDSHFNPSM